MKTYTLTLEQIEFLSDALSAADGHIACDSEDKRMVHMAHLVLLQVLGADEGLVYGPNYEEAA